MGLLFVLVIQVFAISAVATLLGVGGASMAHIFSKKENRKRNIRFATRAPFVGLISLFISAGVSMILVSAVFDVDPGIGDSWYTRLSEKCELGFIDVMDVGDIYCCDIGEAKIANVTMIQQSKEKVFCKTTNGEYYLLNTSDTTVARFADEYTMRRAAQERPDLVPVAQFYSEKRWGAAGIPLVMAGLASLLVSGLSVWVLKKRIWRRFAERPGPVG